MKLIPLCDVYFCFPLISGPLLPPNRIKLKIIKSGEPRFEQDNLVIEGSMNYINNEWQCRGNIVSPGFGEFYMVPSHSDTTIPLSGHLIYPPKDTHDSQETVFHGASKKTIAIVLPILFLLLAFGVCAVLFIVYRKGCFGRHNDGMTRFVNPTYDPQSNSNVS